jgi:hypothetical protein
MLIQATKLSSAYGLFKIPLFNDSYSPSHTAIDRKLYIDLSFYSFNKLVNLSVSNYSVSQSVRQPVAQLVR